MDFPPIPEDFGSINGASFDFNDFVFETGDAEAVQSSVRTYAAIEATETARTSDRAPSHLSRFQSSSRPPQLSQGDPILVVHSLGTHALTLHRLSASSCLLSLLFAFCSYCICYISLAIIFI